MSNFYFKGLLIFTASVITLASFAQVRGPYDRACDPIPTKDGIAITPEVKVPPMTEAQRQAHFIKVKGQNKSAASICTDLIVDGGFETGGIPSTLWDPETSTNFGTPVCNVSSCGTGNNTASPRTGAIWVWFGGTNASETATIGQTITILPGTATLNFWMRIGAVNAPFTDVLNVRVDGTIVQTFTEPSVAEGAYTLRSINLDAYADAHAILFEYVGAAGGTANFLIDDVTLDNCPVTTTSDLAITKTDGSPVYTPGGSTTYTIVASNAGPDAVTGATVTDNFPAAISSVAWTAVYAGGATGPASGVGNINATVDMPVGGSATFTAVCTISAGATGALGNTATVAGGGTDPIPANNSATDVDAQSLSISCPSPVTVNSSADGAGNCSGTATWTHPTIAAGSLTRSIDGNTPVSVTPGGPASAVLEVGSHTVTYVFSDGNTPTPNTATCSFMVTVVDDESPTLVCKTTTVFLNAAGNYTLLAGDVFNAAASSDNCSGVLTVTNISPATVSCSQVNQTIPVMVTVQDAAGNPATCTAQITVQEGTTMPENWSSNNVGNANGSAGYNACTSNGQFTASATGFSTSSADVLHLTAQKLCGNVELIAHVAGVSGGGWAGITMRESLMPGSKKVALKTQLANSIRREIRTATNGAASTLNLLFRQHKWLRLVRNGGNFVGYTSIDGSNWSFAFSATVSMTGCIYVGLFAESINNAVTTTATFDHVQVIGGVLPLIQAPQTPVAASNLSPEVYPNPTTGEVNIDLGGYANPVGTVKVFDAYGKLLIKNQLDGSALFRMKLDGADGLYFLSIEVEGEAPVTKRVVIAH